MLIFNICLVHNYVHNMVAHPYSVMAADKPVVGVKSVLYVNSYHPGYRWSDQVQAGIADVLKNESGMEIDLRVEYLDAKRYAGELKGRLGNDISLIWEKNTERSILIS